MVAGRSRNVGSEEQADQMLRDHADRCSCCRQMVASYDAFELHTEDCSHCSDMLRHDDYCPVGLSLQVQWLDDIYDDDDDPRCGVGAELMDRLLKVGRDAS